MIWRWVRSDEEQRLLAISTASAQGQKENQDDYVTNFTGESVSNV